MARKPISKKLRFEVFKRDGFTCQYCGKSAPEVVLEVDHIKPVSKGGTNDILNLITSCFECNRGKSDKLLNENAVLDKQLDQLQQLNERRNQLEMMIEWRKGLKEIDDELVDILAEEFEDLSGAIVNETGRTNLKKLTKKYDYVTLSDAIEESIEAYLDNCETAFKKIGSIAYFKTNPKANKDKDLYYIRGIMKKRFSYLDEGLAIISLRKARDAGAENDELKEIALISNNWTQWKNNMRERGYEIEY